MKIAIITPGMLPVPAVQGGAVENLIDLYLDYNDRHRLHDITVYGISHPAVRRHQALQSEVNHYELVDTHSLTARIKARLFAMRHPHGYYFPHLEYFFELVFRRLKRQHFDLIVLENRPGFVLKLAERLPSLPPVVAHIHADVLYDPRKANVEIVRLTDRFVPISDYIRQRIELVAPPRSSVVVYNGLDTSKFNVREATPVARPSLGFADTDFVAIYWGRLVRDKGIGELLQALLLLSEHPDMKLLVIGSINFSDKQAATTPFLDELRTMADRLQGRVAFTGFVPYDEIPRYLRAADVAVVPSHINEAFGMTCIEACAMGLPVIATNDGGIPETLVGQKHILVDKDGDLPAQLAEAMLRVKAAPANYQGNALNPVFTAEAYAKAFFASLENLH